MNKLNIKTSRILALTTMMLVSLLSPNNVSAQYYGQTSNSPVIVVDKKIGFAGNKAYYDNVSSSLKTFAEGDEIVFKIVVENKGASDLDNIVLKDTLPSYLTMLMYPGTLIKPTNTIETKAFSLKTGQSKEFLFIARISNLPVSLNATEIQLNNKVCVNNGIASDCDNAKYFVETKSVPKTGSPDMAVKTISVVSALVVAVALRKKARGY